VNCFNYQGCWVWCNSSICCDYSICLWSWGIFHQLHYSWSRLGCLLRWLFYLRLVEIWFDCYWCV